jgi:DNA mismatch repair protein MutS2
MHLEWGTLEGELAARLCSPAARADPEVSPRIDGDLSGCRARHDEVDQLERMLQSSTELDLGRRLQHVVPLREPLARAVRGLPLLPIELLATADVLAVAVSVANALRAAEDAARADVGALAELLGTLDPPGQLAAKLDRAIDRGGPGRDSGGEVGIADAASPTLASLRDRVRRARQSLRQAAERLLRRPGLADAFGDAYVTEREGRVVVPVRASAFSSSGAPGTLAGIIHDTSSSGQTLFIEPHALVDDNNALRTAIAAARAEEQRIIAELSAEIGEHADRISGCATALVRVDAVHARLLVSQALGGVRPQLLEPVRGAVLELPDARHPIMLLRGREVVPNHLVVAVGTALVVSGPNAGGKTVALKTIGLCVLLAKAGVRLPTQGTANVPVFRSVVTDVGDDQSIARDLSTFTAHIHNVRLACASAAQDGDGTIVLLDEVAVGTDPDQGAALAEAIVTSLVELGATLVVTTHYERLKLLAHADPTRFVNAAVGFDLQELRSTFRVHVGIPGNSSALAVARRVGLPAEVVDRATALIGAGTRRVDELLGEVAALREQLLDQTVALEQERGALAATRGRLEAIERDENARASAKLLRAHSATAAELRALQTELRAARKAARRGDDPAEIDDAVRRAGEAVDRHRPAPAVPVGAPPATIERGDRVRIESLGMDGEVVAIKGDRITVQLASSPHGASRLAARTTVTRDELRPAGSKPARTATPGPRPQSIASDAGRHFGADARPVEPGIDNVVDLRGARPDEALALLEVSLARAIEDDQEVLIVRHGHGSGALRQAVREHLPRLDHVTRHRPGLAPEGGDGVTVVWVRG